jgi:hypothetical protein
MSVQPLEVFTPYSSVAPLFTATPQWMSEGDAQRVTAYQVYEQIYWSVPDTFKLMSRGAEDRPIYVPTGKTIVDTTNRYVGKSWGPIIDPAFGSTSEQAALRLALAQLFSREKMFSLYNSSKRYGMIRGDWLFHIIGNDLKAPGTRIKIEAVDPAAYFPVPHPDDPDRIIGCHIVEQIQTEDGWKLKRQTYQKGADPVANDGSDTTIYNSVATFNGDSWETFDAKPVTIITPIHALPPQITALPVYHLKNIETPGDPFGTSELRGLERIMAAVNQAISDEELALALDGLGVYATDAGTPAGGQWIIGPGRVVQKPKGTDFTRVSGVQSVVPMQSHLEFLMKALKEGSGTPDIAIGIVQVAQVSGISLLLQMGPMLSKAEERETGISGVMDNFLHDLITQWLPAYEQTSFNAMCVSSFGDVLPPDRAAILGEIIQIAGLPGVVDTAWIQGELAKLGYVFANETAGRAMNELQARAQALDPFGARIVAEEGDVQA